MNNTVYTKGIPSFYSLIDAILNLVSVMHFLWYQKQKYCLCIQWIKNGFKTHEETWGGTEISTFRNWQKTPTMVRKVNTDWRFCLMRIGLYVVLLVQISSGVASEWRLSNIFQQNVWHKPLHNHVSCRSVALRSKKVGTGDRRATVLYMQENLRFTATIFECFISMFSHCQHKM